MATKKRSCNETKKWEYILTTLKYLICLILRVLLFFAAYIMLKCSKLFETLSEYLKTNINTEDLFETPDENKCNCSFFNPNNQSKNILDENQVVDDTIKETLNINCNGNDLIEQEIEHESPIKKINNIVDPVDETLNIKLGDNNKNELQLKIVKELMGNIKEASTNKQCNDYANLEPNIQHELQKENINDISDTVNETFNIKCADDNLKNELQLKVVEVITGYENEVSINIQCNVNPFMEHKIQHESLEEEINYIPDNKKCNDNAYMEPNIQHELQEETIYDISDIIETSSIKCIDNAFMEHSIQHELQEQNINNTSDIINESISIKCIDNAFVEHSIQNELQEQNINNISDIINESISIKCIDNACIEHSIEYELKEKNINDISNSINEISNIKCADNNLKNELKFKIVHLIGNEKKASINKQCNDNAYVEHKNQQESHEEKINNISDSVNENLSIKPSVVDGYKNELQLKEAEVKNNTKNIRSTNKQYKSSSFGSNDQNKLQVNQKLNKVSELQPKLNEVYTNTIDEKLNEKSICEKNTEKIDNEIITTDPYKVENGSRFPHRTMNIIVSTIKENEVKNKQLKTGGKLNRDLDRTSRVSKPTINNRNPYQTNEIISINTSNNVSKKKELPMKVETQETTNSEEVYDNYGKTTSCKSTNNRKNGNQNYNSHENKNSKNKYELSNLKEVDKDIFSLDSEYSLALCVTDNLTTSNVCFDFKIKFGGIDVLLDQHLSVGDVGEIVHGDQYIFYLITKKKSAPKSSSVHFLEKASNNLLIKMKKLGLTKLAFPLYGLFHHPISEAKNTISRVFSGSNIEIIVCTAQSNSKMLRPIPPKLMYTSKHLWEMEPQTDILIFIDMGKMYLDNWRDEVVENINAKYPFKDRFLKDINIKPIALGDVWSYKIGIEILFCIFIKPEHENPSYFKCLNKAFNEIKSEVTGYRYLAIQLERPSPLNLNNITGRTLILLTSIFNQASAEIWICGDTKNINTQKFQHYKNTVHTAIEMNKRGSNQSTMNRNKQDKKRHSLNSSTTSYNSSENNHNKHDDNFVGQKPKFSDNSMTDNWDSY